MHPITKVVGLSLSLAMGLSMLSVRPGHAEGPTISGYVETNWSYNFNRPSTKKTSLAVYEDFDRDINNNVHLSFTGSFGEGIGYTVEIDAGNEARITSGAEEKDFDIQEAYLTYAPANLGFKIGKFATFQGIEVLEGPTNPTISRGYLYGFAECFTHVGGVLTYTAGPLDFAAGAVNGWDVSASDNNDSKTLVWKMGFDGGDALGLTLSGYHGPEQDEFYHQSELDQTTDPALMNTSGNNRSNVDLTGVTKIIPNVELWFQLNYGQEEQVAGVSLARWSGVGVQPVIKFGEKWSLGARVEYFNDKHGSRTEEVRLSATNFTVTPGYMVTDNIGVKAEYRYDRANKKIWENSKGAEKDTNSTAGLQAYVMF